MIESQWPEITGAGYRLLWILGFPLAVMFAWSGWRLWRAGRMTWGRGLNVFGQALSWAGVSMHSAWFDAFRVFGTPGWMINLWPVGLFMIERVLAAIMHHGHFALAWRDARRRGR